MCVHSQESYQCSIRLYGKSEIGNMTTVQFQTKGYFRRMHIYLAEMYPVPVRVLSSVLLYISFTAFLGSVHGVEVAVISPFTFVGSWSLFALMLILRLMDELKDKEIDRELFSDRPVPSGRVLESDIGFSLVILIALFLGVNLWVGKAFWAAVIVLAYSVGMFRYFFVREMLRENLLLNLATHNPIIPITLLYVFILFSVEHNLTINDVKWLNTLLLIGMYWAAFLAWEIARKIRCREEENEYVTYSKILGRVGATLTIIGTQSITLAIAVWFYWSLSLSGVFLGTLLAGYGITLSGHLRFLLNPSPVTSKLRPFAELYILAIVIVNIWEHTLFV